MFISVYQEIANDTFDTSIINFCCAMMRRRIDNNLDSQALRKLTVCVNNARDQASKINAFRSEVDRLRIVTRDL